MEGRRPHANRHFARDASLAERMVWRMISLRIHKQPSVMAECGDWDDLPDVANCGTQCMEFCKYVGPAEEGLRFRTDQLVELIKKVPKIIANYSGRAKNRCR